MTLLEVVEYVAWKELARAEQDTVSTELMNAVRSSKSKNVSSSCWACLGKSHDQQNSFRSRKNNCPAWDHECDKCSNKGHYSKACRQCTSCSKWGHKNEKSNQCKNNNKYKDKIEETSTIHTTLASSFICSQINGQFKIPRSGRFKNKRVIPLTHRIFSKNQGWQSKPSLPQPMLRMSVKPCPNDHKYFGYSIQNESKLKTCVDSPMCADTGCQSTAISLKFAYKLGFGKKDLIPVSSKMNGAGRDDLGVIGAIVLEFAYKDKNGLNRWTKQLCYVCTQIDTNYLSRKALVDLGSISDDFPIPVFKNESTMNSYRSASQTCASVVPEEPSCCNCPRRPNEPPHSASEGPKNGKMSKKII